MKMHLSVSLGAEEAICQMAEGCVALQKEKKTKKKREEDGKDVMCWVFFKFGS